MRFILYLASVAVLSVSASLALAESLKFTDVYYEGKLRDVDFKIVITPINEDNLEYCWTSSDGKSDCPHFPYKRNGNLVTFESNGYGVWKLNVLNGEMTFTNSHGASYYADLVVKKKNVKKKKWNTKPNDQRLSKEELTNLVVGKTLEYEDGGKSVLDTVGGYEFHVRGKVYRYRYRITDEGAICIAAADNRARYRARCDLIVINNGNVISINEKGQRYRAIVK